MIAELNKERHCEAIPALGVVIEIVNSISGLLRAVTRSFASARNDGNVLILEYKVIDNR